MLTFVSIIGIIYIVGTIVWLGYELIHAPTIEDEHTECVEARKAKHVED